MRWWLLLLLVGCKDSVDRGDPPPPVADRAQPREPPPRQCTPNRPVCRGDDVVECAADGTFTGARTLQDCKAGCREGRCVDTCGTRDVELVYVVDNRNQLYSFDPHKLPADPFRRVGTLACVFGSTPNSMAVDRSGVAWLGYQNGLVYRASILDAHCARDGVTPRDAPRTFGMGFVTDGPNATTERLFVAGSDDDRVHVLATLAPANGGLTWQPVARITSPTHHPELTGTGDGKLFAYFPGPGRGYVQQLDRTSGKPLGTRWTLTGTADHIDAYAFAHWGGSFWVFITIDGNSTVHKLDMKTGKQTLVREQLPFEIVGAGVSTCAPLLEREL